MSSAAGSSQTVAYKQVDLFRLLEEINVRSESDEESWEESKPLNEREIEPISDRADQEFMDTTISLRNLNIEESLSEDEDLSPVFEEPSPFKVFYAKGFEPEPDFDKDSEAYKIIQDLVNTGRKNKPLCTFKSETSTYPIYADDLKRLLAPHLIGGKKKAYLNDALVDFFLRYVVENVKYPRDIKLYDCTFYQQFKSNFHKNPERLKSVENIFFKEFLMIPICQDLHWILFVCCFLPYLHYRYNCKCTSRGSLRQRRAAMKQRNSPFYNCKSVPDSLFNPKNQRTCLLAFDSLGPKSSIKHEKIFQEIREYLSFEWNCTFGRKMSFNCHNLPAFVVPVPNQQNFYDCGIFVMYFTAYFIKDLYVYRTQEMPPDMHERFSTDSSNLRYELVKLFETIIKKQRSKQVEEEEVVDDDDDDDDIMIV